MVSLEDRRRRSLRVIALVAFSAVLCTVVIAILIGQRDSSGPLVAAETDAADTDNTHDSKAAHRVSPSLGTGDSPSPARTREEQPSVVAGSTPTGEGIGEQSVQDLQSAVEATLHGHLDLDSILDAAARIADLGTEPHAYPVPSVPGRVEFPVPNTPEGVEARLAIAQSKRFADVITLRIELDEPFEPYLLVGAVRNGPTVEITSWHDEQGELQDFAVQTSVQPNRMSWDYGLPLSDGEVVEGVYFHMELADPSAWSAKPFGLIQGMPGTFESNAVPGQDPVSRMSRFRSLGTQLLNLRRELER